MPVYPLVAKAINDTAGLADCESAQAGKLAHRVADRNGGPMLIGSEYRAPDRRDPDTAVRARHLCYSRVGVAGPDSVDPDIADLAVADNKVGAVAVSEW
jgi:hypothetical protein